MIRSWPVVIITSLFIISLSMLPTLHQFQATGPDQYFLGTHNNLLDYPMFVAAINRGQRGEWLNKAVFTSESQPGDFVHWIYIPLGKLTNLFGINAILTYHLARILFGFLLSISTFYFIKQIFASSANPKVIFSNQFAQPAQDNLIRKIGIWVAGEHTDSGQGKTSSNKQERPTIGGEKSVTEGLQANRITICAFLLSLFSAGFTRFIFTNNHVRFIGPYLDWWTGGDVLRRITFQPHAMLKNILLLFVLASFSRIFSTQKLEIKNWKFVILLSLGFLLGLHDPMNSLSIFTLLILYFTFLLAKYKFKFNPRLKFIRYTIFIYLFTSSLGLSLTILAFKYTPWKAVSGWESHQFYIVPFWEYANHLGPIFYLGIPGLALLFFSAINSKKTSHLYTNKFLACSITILTFTSLFFILTGISLYLNLSTLRFFQTPVHIFLSIGTVYLFILICRNSPRKTFICTLLTILITLPAYNISLKSQWNEWKTQYWNIYPDSNSVEVLKYLRKVSNVNDIVLTNTLTAQIIPTITGNIVYAGHPVSTIDFATKLKLVNDFFAGNMTTQQAKKFVESTGAKFVTIARYERTAINVKQLPFLQLVNSSPTLDLYQVHIDKSLP